MGVRAPTNAEGEAEVRGEEGRGEEQPHAEDEHTQFCLNNDVCGCGRKICACFGLALCSGPLLIVLGMVLLITASFAPRPDIDEYNMAVDNWKRGDYAAFMFVARGHTYALQSNNSHFNELFQNDTTEADDALMENDSRLHTYDGYYLKFTMEGVPMASPPKYTGGVVYESVEVQNMQANRSYNVRVRTMIPSSIAVRDLQCDINGHYNADRCALRCEGLMGHWDAVKQLCKFKQILQEFCIKVNHNGDVDESDTLCFGANSEVFSQKLPDDGSSPVIQSVSVVLRSYADPFIAAISLTNGELYFNNEESTARAGMGVACIIFGAGFIATVCAGVCMLYRRGRFKTHQRPRIIPLKPSSQVYTDYPSCSHLLPLPHPVVSGSQAFSNPAVQLHHLSSVTSPSSRMTRPPFPYILPSSVSFTTNIAASNFPATSTKVAP